MGRTLLGLGLVVGLAACNPYGSSAFTCETDDQCGGDGRCEVIGFCSFPDERCGAGGRAYGEHSGPRSGDCATSDTMPIIDAPPEPDAPAMCTPNARYCFGSAIETCRADGQGFDETLRSPCALACDSSGATPQCLAASNLSISDQVGCGNGSDNPIDLIARTGAVVTIGASSISCTGCDFGVTSIPNRGTSPNVWYCLKSLVLERDAVLRASNVGPVTLFVAGQTQIDATINFDGDDASGTNGGRGIGPGAHNGASNPSPNTNGTSGAGPCAGGGGQRVTNIVPTLTTAGGGGGAGAAGDGGDGGDGNGPMQDVGEGGSGGNASAQCDSPSFAQLLGGSGGGSGGGGDCTVLAVPTACGGGGGGGGGALHIATRAILMGTGSIDVSGGNGANGTNNPLEAQATGGGGGAGGMIFLEAKVVMHTGQLVTRGGNGGRNGGAGAGSSLDGQNGGNGTTEGDGGRGGGGAAGRIRINAASGVLCERAQPSAACATGPLRPQ